MFTLLALALGFAAVVVLAVLGGVVALVLGIVTLPFRLLGFGLKLGLGLLFLPFLLLLAAIGFGIGILALAIRMLPLLLVIAGIVWLVRRSRRSGGAHGVRV